MSHVPSSGPSTETSYRLPAWSFSIEWLYACSSLLNDAGRYAYYGRAGDCPITGDEDGVKHCATNVLYGLQHLGYTVPPQADAGLDRRGRPGTLVDGPGAGTNATPA